MVNAKNVQVNAKLVLNAFSLHLLIKSGDSKSEIRDRHKR